MLTPDCHHIYSFFDNKSLQDSMRLVAAYAVERELQERRNERLSRADDERDTEHLQEKPRDFRR
jgi:hypothetical protein